MTKRKSPLHYSRLDDSGLFVCGLPTTDGDRTINFNAVNCAGCWQGIRALRAVTKEQAVKP